MAENISSIHFNGKIKGGASIDFIRAEMTTKYDLPLALIRYAIQGQEQENGLRLDLDKRVFLDHLEDEEKNKVLDKAAPEIVEVVGSALDY